MASLSCPSHTSPTLTIATKSFDAKSVECFANQLRRLHFLVHQFGVPMQSAADIDDPVLDVLCLLAGFVCGHVSVSGRGLERVLEIVFSDVVTSDPGWH